MRFKSYLVAGTLACIFLGCVFQPDENFVVIDPAPKAVLSDTDLRSVDLMTLPDTFEIVKRETPLNIRMQFESAVFKSAMLWIDGKQDFGLSSVLNFDIRAADYADGYHKLEVVIITNTGTGSLADLEGGEELEWRREWTFHVERVTPPLISITAIEPYNGQLAIDFDPNPMLTDRLLELEYRYSSFVVRWSYLITNPTQTRIIDDRFIEGSIKATITNLSIDPDFPSSSYTMEKQFATVPDIVQSTTDGHGNVITKCSRSIFYNNVKHYKLTVDGVQKRTTSGSDTTVVTSHLGFSASYAASLRTYAARLNNGSDTVRLLKSVTPHILVGEAIDHEMFAVCWSPLNPQFGFAVDDVREELQVLEGATVVDRFPVDTLENTVPATIATSNDGQHAVIEINGRILRVGRDGSSTIALDTRALPGVPQDILEICLGDRYLAFAARETSTAAVYLYDLQENLLIGDPIPIPNINFFSSLSLRLSPDDRFLAVLQSTGLKVYTIANQTLTLTKTFSSFDADDVYFHTAGNSQLMLIRSNGFTMYDPATDVSVVRTYSGNLADGFQASRVIYDPVSGYFASVTTSNHYVVNPENGEVLRRIPASGNSLFVIYDGNLYKGGMKYDCQF